MARRTWWIWPVFAGMLAMALWDFAMAKEHLTMDQPKYVTVMDKDKDKNVTLRVGDTLIVRLESPHSEKGYLWQITKTNKELLKPLDKIPEDKVGKSRPGLVDLQVFYLKAEAAGKGDLQLEYRQATEKEAKAASSYKIMVQID